MRHDAECSERRCGGASTNVHFVWWRFDFQYLVIKTYHNVPSSSPIPSFLSRAFAYAFLGSNVERTSGRLRVLPTLPQGRFLHLAPPLPRGDEQRGVLPGLFQPRMVHNYLQILCFF
jgi:hypothetical protein